MKYIYGPVKSRRLGSSLGISLTPYKVCSFDCIYCQLGPTTQKTAERKEYVPMEEVLSELSTCLKSPGFNVQELSYITLAGFGEPTLNEKTGELISRIKRLTPVPVAVLTNSSLLSQEIVRQQLLEADVVMPTLCCGQQKDFERINRPAPGLKLEDIINGLIAFRKQFKGKLWLEIMLLKGINADVRKMKQIKEALELIRPDRIFLNSPVRPPSEIEVKPPDQRALARIKEFFGEKAEII
jgi:wyosine [tRNA(Phe)-imidazoG37] synthetase (radical SAM superfamily)